MKRFATGLIGIIILAQTINGLIMFHPTRLIKEYFEVLELVSQFENDPAFQKVSKHKPLQHRPMVGAVFETFWRNIVNLFTDFSWENIFAFQVEVLQQNHHT